jgi:CO dehydrogenase maturation factor
MGTVKSVGSGCTCPANALIRALLQHLIVKRDEFVVLDLEAGIEHMGRGTAGSVDSLLMIVEPSLKSMEIAKKIHHLAGEAEIEKNFVIGNKISGEAEGEIIERFTAENGLSLLGLIPYDAQISKCDMEGETPLKYADSSEGVLAIRRMGEELLSDY